MERIRSGKLTTYEKVEVGIEETLFDDDDTKERSCTWSFDFSTGSSFGLLIL